MCATLAISKIGALIDTRVIAFLQDFKVIKCNRIKEMTATNLGKNSLICKILSTFE